MHQKRGLPCPRAFMILTRYNGFRGSICVTNGYYGTQPTHSYEHVDMRETYTPWIAISETLRVSFEHLS
ncbi:hypothetical protein SAMN05518871_108236 [Psychrobacillus sp. OK028]|nr:hypothetical protein SAMN05518871_108236 [Psychrobacillus sp. OK028]